jgi:hypothetical protein
MLLVDYGWNAAISAIIKNNYSSSFAKYFLYNLSNRSINKNGKP